MVFTLKSFTTGLKGIATSIPIAIGSWMISLIMLKFLVFGTILMIAWVLVGIFVWGWLARSVWGWK